MKVEAACVPEKLMESLNIPMDDLLQLKRIIDKITLHH